MLCLNIYRLNIERIILKLSNNFSSVKNISMYLLSFGTENIYNIYLET